VVVEGQLGSRLLVLPLVVSIPVVVGIAILRHRLYDIDHLINRTLVYGLLTAILGSAYAVGVLVIGQCVSPGDHPRAWSSPPAR
jgi:hypothetical protein